MKSWDEFLKESLKHFLHLQIFLMESLEEVPISLICWYCACEGTKKGKLTNATYFSTYSMRDQNNQKLEVPSSYTSEGLWRSSPYNYPSFILQVPLRLLLKIRKILPFICTGRKGVVNDLKYPRRHHGRGLTSSLVTI